MTYRTCVCVCECIHVKIEVINNSFSATLAVVRVSFALGTSASFILFDITTNNIVSYSPYVPAQKWTSDFVRSMLDRSSESSSRVIKLGKISFL